MKKKSKGVTLIELVIAIALTTVILLVVYTFFGSNSKSLVMTDLNSTLQTDNKKIQKELMTIGTQAKGITSLVPSSGVPIDTSVATLSSLSFDSEERVSVASITLNNINGDNVIISHTGTTLSIELLGVTNILSNNVKAFKIIPLNINMISDKTTFLIKDLPGYQFYAELEIKKGTVLVNQKVSAITKFRNKDI